MARAVHLLAMERSLDLQWTKHCDLSGQLTAWPAPKNIADKKRVSCETKMAKVSIISLRVIELNCFLVSHELFSIKWTMGVARKKLKPTCARFVWNIELILVSLFAGKQSYKKAEIAWVNTVTTSEVAIDR